MTLRRHAQRALVARDADRLEEIGLRRARLAALDQLEQGDERRRLGAALEARDLVVEDEAAAGAHEQPEALDERPHGDRAPPDRRRVDALGRLEQVQHRLGQAPGLLVDERSAAGAAARTARASCGTRAARRRRGARRASPPRA